MLQETKSTNSVVVSSLDGILSMIDNFYLIFPDPVHRFPRCA